MDVIHVYNACVWYMYAIHSGPIYSLTLPYALTICNPSVSLEISLPLCLCMTLWLKPGTSTWAWGGAFHSGIGDSPGALSQSNESSSSIHPYPTGPHDLPAHHLGRSLAALASSLPSSQLLWVHGCIRHVPSGRQQQMTSQGRGRKSVTCGLHYKASHSQNLKTHRTEQSK